MKPSGPLGRTKALRADPEKTREWRARTARRLPAESARRKAERPARRAVRAVVLDRDQGCVARGVLPGRCWHPAGEPLDVHEVISRGRWRAGYLVADNCVSLCRGHHQWVTTHPAAATQLGFLARNNPG